MTEAVDLERLLAHATWLRALARRLVGPSSADDAVQETLIAAMRSPPAADREARPWLARILRNVTRMQFRGDSRRARREEAAALLPAAPIAPDVSAHRLETHRALCELVLGLDEPYRRTLVDHYFEGLSMADIARRDAIPEATVRWRHKQALERVRARLDERSHGDRRAWVTSLAPIAAGPANPNLAIAGGLVMNKLVIGMIVVVAASLAVSWQRTRAAATAGTTTPSVPAAASSASPASSGPAHRVTQLASAADRERIAAEISVARAHRASASAGPAPSLPAGSTALEPSTIRAAMREVIPFVETCYEAALPGLVSPELQIRAHLVLRGDPDIGTLVDADRILDDHDAPLPPTLDDCLRSTFQTLELPPLAEGDEVDVNYPISFSAAPPPAPEPAHAEGWQTVPPMWPRQ